jgi:RimJ/RimL family protein N-acetyltransferase
MNKIITLETEHLFLRQWEGDDFVFYCNLTSNKNIMKFFPKTLTKEESDNSAKKFMNIITQRGWGFWAVEEKSTGLFLGYAGLHAPATKFDFSPCVEIGWRISKEYWDNGYVLEAGRKILDCAFNIIGLEEVVYFSSIHNKIAETMVQELGMHKKLYFHHPFVEKENYLSQHYLYKIKNN